MNRFLSFLSFKKTPASIPEDDDEFVETLAPAHLRVSEYAPGQELGGWVVRASEGGVIVMLPNRETGMVVRDEISWPGYPMTYKKGSWVNVVVTTFKPERGLYLSIRGALRTERINAVYDKLNVGDVLEGRIKSIKDYGVFVTIGPGVSGLYHESRIQDISAFDRHSIGKSLNVRVIEVNRSADRIQLEAA